MIKEDDREVATLNAAVNAWIDAHKEALVQDVKDFCAIPSVRGEAKEGMPYGEAPYAALQFGEKLCKQYGFSVREYADVVATADFDAALPRHLDILAHTDVVPAGEGWTVTEPFTVLEKDGKLYGRGTSDDKGPLMSALYAMRAIKECGIPLKKGVRLIMGTDEECGSSDIEKYYALEPEAAMTFSPDAEFPLINIEKGQFRGIVFKDYPDGDAELPRLLSLKAGIAVNAVPQKAVLTFEGLSREAAAEAVRRVEARCHVTCQWTGEQEITVMGVSAHASTPETGRNAGLAAVLLLTELPLPASPMREDLKKLLTLFPYGVTDGSGLHIAMSDEESHDLTLSLDLFSIDPSRIECEFDARTPVMANAENCYDKAKKTVEDMGFRFTASQVVPPHRVDGDSDFVRTLLASYEAVTGRPGECLAIGGGTYVHDLKNGVAFGAVLPDIDTRMHGADEFIGIDNLLLAAKVYAEAILRLCG